MELGKISDAGKKVIAREIKSGGILDELADENDTEVRLEVAKNKCTLDSTLLRLLKDENETVRHEAEKALKVSINWQNGNCITKKEEGGDLL